MELDWAKNNAIMNIEKVRDIEWLELLKNELLPRLRYNDFDSDKIAMDMSVLSLCHQKYITYAESERLLSIIKEWNFEGGDEKEWINNINLFIEEYKRLIKNNNDINKWYFKIKTREIWKKK